MSDRYDEVDHWFRDYEREREEFAEWLEARELAIADRLAERGGLGEKAPRDQAGQGRKASDDGEAPRVPR